MYMFDGVDYSKEPSAADKTAFDKLIEGKFIDFYLLNIFLTWDSYGMCGILSQIKNYIFSCTL